MNDDWYTSEAMIQEGGSFVSKLGEAFRVADPENRAKIKQAWPEYLEKYAARGRVLRERDEGLQTQYRQRKSVPC